ncbi:rhoptry neck protein ron10 [Cystoisospora suis]|uniref:Rhoptry neck protein ron10 n=1 Tax=Cystoisospora suis TaxID=483139 RepID=A0A2C6K3K5_9APIC|nr:rhoptry neck protein ron10 [Cystoisospora suis]
MGALTAAALLLGSERTLYGLQSASPTRRVPLYTALTRYPRMAVLLASVVLQSFLFQQVSYASRTASQHPIRYSALLMNSEDSGAARRDSPGPSRSEARFALELPSSVDDTSSSSEGFSSFISLRDEPPARPSGLWGNLKHYVELGTSDDRSQPQKDSEGKSAQEPKPANETSETTPGEKEENKKEEVPAPSPAKEATSEEKPAKKVAEEKAPEKGEKETSEKYHLMAQKKLRETREDLVKKTAGTPDEYDETGDYPSLCGSWQSVPSSPHFASDPAFTRFSTADASPLPSVPEDAGDRLPFPTCQWLPHRGVHVSERRTYGFDPNVVDIERYEFSSTEGCLPRHLSRVWLYSGYWHPTKAVRDSKSHAEELSLELSWVSVNVQLDANVMVHAKHLEQPAARFGTPTDQEKTCWDDGDRLWVPPMKQLHLDLRDVCTQPHGDIIYSQRVSPEFVISPQDVAVSHEVLAGRLKRRLRKRLAALQNQKKAHSDKAPTETKTGLHSAAEQAIQNNKWRHATEQKFVHRWKNYLSQQSRWTEQVCQWQLLRESCLLPPSWNNSHNAHRTPATDEEQKSQCYLPAVRHSLSRENGIDYLELPLFPYTDEADTVRLRKVGECNPHKKVGVFTAKGGGQEQRRHSAKEELSSVPVVYKTIHPHTGKPEIEEEKPAAESGESIKKHEAVPTEKIKQMETLLPKREQAPTEPVVPPLKPTEEHSEASGPAPGPQRGPARPSPEQSEPSPEQSVPSAKQEPPQEAPAATEEEPTSSEEGTAKGEQASAPAEPEEQTPTEEQGAAGGEQASAPAETEEQTPTEEQGAAGGEQESAPAEPEGQTPTEEQGAAGGEQTSASAEPAPAEGAPASAAGEVQEASEEESGADTDKSEAQQPEEGSSSETETKAPAASETGGEPEQEEGSEQEPEDGSASD